MRNLIAKDIINQIKNYGSFYYIQWHITSRCTENCKHCYLDRNIRSESFSLIKSKSIIDEIYELSIINKKPAYIAFTGGDPLLYLNMEDLIKYAIEKNIGIILKGTPWLLDNRKANYLKKLGINRYNLSLDGLENTHDKIRRTGSFKKTTEAIRILKENNITVSVKYTVSKANINQMIDVMKYCSEIGVDLFDFQRYSPGQVDYEDNLVDSQIYYNLLHSTLSAYEEIKNRGFKMNLLFRDHLWMLLFKETGIITDDFLDKISNNERALCGCTMANGDIIVINYNGDVLPCAKIPDFVLGNVHNEKLKVIMQSKKLSSLSNIDNYVKCSKCKLALLCRGCPAVNFYKDRNIFAPDMQCWAELD